jgi:hypothetical protein
VTAFDTAIYVSKVVIVAMNENLPLIVVVVGWVVTHFLSLRSQTTNLRLQVLDRARNDITKELRSAESWCSQLIGILTAQSMLAETPELAVRRDWKPAIPKVVSLLEGAPYEWISRLEDYEILFPETAAVRERLVGRQREIHGELSRFSSAFMSLAYGERPDTPMAALFENAAKWIADVYDQQALLGDLGVHLQNAALSKIVGRTIPARIPRDAALPKIVRGKDGLLWIEPDRPEKLVVHTDPPGRGAA